MMGDSSDVNSGELEEIAKNFAQVVAKNVSAKMDSLVKELHNEKSKNQNLSASFAESEEKNEFLKQEMEKVRKENELLKENMQAIHSDKENLQKESESLNLELTELKSAFSSVENTFKSFSNIVKTSATPKGQLISKGLFNAIVSTKNQGNFFKDFCPSL